jgi:hypothetical protein
MKSTTRVWVVHIAQVLLVTVGMFVLLLGVVCFVVLSVADYPVIYAGGSLNHYFKPGDQVDLRIAGRYGTGIGISITEHYTVAYVPGPSDQVTGLSYDGTRLGLTWGKGWSRGNAVLICSHDVVTAMERATGQKAVILK